MIATLRSLLFVPGDSEERLSAAFASEADAVVADLEDAVPGDRKAAARALLADGLPGSGPGGPGRCVRVNAPETGLTGTDLDAVAHLELDALLLPKATPEAVEALGPEGPPIIAIVESAIGLRLAYEIASAARVVALALGAADLGADLRLEPRPDAAEIAYARSKLVVDSAAAGIRAPIDRVFPSRDDEGGLEADARLARALGFGAKSCTHAGALATVNRVFAPRDDGTAASKAQLFAP